MDIHARGRIGGLMTDNPNYRRCTFCGKIKPHDQMMPSGKCIACEITVVNMKQSKK